MSEQIPQGYPGQPIPKKKSWFARHKILSALGALILLIIIGSAASSGGSGTTEDQLASPASTSAPGKTAPAAPKTKAPAATKAPDAGLTFPGKLEDDQAVKPGTEIMLSGWSTTAGALTKRSDAAFGDQLCAPITMTNRDDDSQDYNSYSWKLQSPSGDTKDLGISESNNKFGNGTLAPNGKKTGTLCWDDPDEKGTHVVLWQPDMFSSEARGAWVSKR